ncbi:MAG: GIY-YIG nuclease family protein [Anaerolineae bacterium]|nr:GIY-YIG nuclease family protein [Anaerolineae bacterium]
MIYFLRQGMDGPIKIGTSRQAVLKSRISMLQTATPYPLHLLGVIEGGHKVENHLHERFATSRLNGEWFAAETELLEFIETHARPFSEYEELDSKQEITATAAQNPAPQSKGLGEKSLKLLQTLAKNNQIIFSTADAHRILGGKPIAVYKLLHDLVQAKRLQPLDKGRYIRIPLDLGPQSHYTTHEFLIASHLLPGGYIAYWTALHHHSLTEQIPRDVWIVAPRRRQPITLLGVTYTFVALRPHKRFGAQTVWIEGRPVAITDLEKSVVDALDHLEYCGGITEVAKALAIACEERGADLERLSAYALRMQNGALLKRLGYLAEQLALPVGDYTAQWQAALTGGRALLDPGRPDAGPIARRWRLRVNVSEAEIQG